MKCETVEQKIIETLEGRELEKELEMHIQRCTSCKEFYEYIINLSKEFKNIEKLKPSPYLEKKILKKVLKKPVYNKIFVYLTSSLIFLFFIFILFIPYFLKFLFPEIIIIFSKALSLCNIFSEVFHFKICYIIPSLIFIFILANSFILWTSFFLLRKITFKEVRL